MKILLDAKRADILKRGADILDAILDSAENNAAIDLIVNNFEELEALVKVLRQFKGIKV